MRILYIARAYPPTVGGMENLAHQLRQHLSLRADVSSLINHHGKAALPVFLPFALGAAIHHVRARRPDAVHLADALLAPIGAAIKAATDVPVTASVCGLDVTYRNRAYQAVVIRALRELDLALPISRATQSAMHQRTGRRPASRVIPLGITPLNTATPDAIASFHSLLGAPRSARVIVTVGRLIKRKGVAWFTECVLPALPPHVLYCVIGTGPMAHDIQAAAERAGVGNRVRLLGSVENDVLAAAYATADLFIMPNIPTAGDMEGFGLVALEAAASGLPVVAANLEGITEAIIDDENGVLVEPQNVGAWLSTLRQLLALEPPELSALGQRYRSYTTSHFGWERAAALYIDAIGSVHAPRDRSPYRSSPYSPHRS